MNTFGVWWKSLWKCPFLCEPLNGETSHSFTHNSQLEFVLISLVRDLSEIHNWKLT